MLPGLVREGTKENLPGKLVFLFSTQTSGVGTNEMSAGIYEFDLQDKKLRKVTAAPEGLFITSNE